MPTLPIDLGLLASVTSSWTEPVEDIQAVFAGRYACHPFVEVVEDPPGLRDVRDTNLARIMQTVGEDHAVVFAAIDNLCKGPRARPCRTST